MRHIWFAILVALVLAEAFVGISLMQQARAVVRVGDDPGGMVVDYLRWFDRMRAANVEIRLEGSCVSACTLVLSLPPDAACIMPTAKLGFHLASVNNEPDPALTDQLVLRYYPVVVQKWIKDHGPLAEAPIYMLGAEAISIGAMRECEQ